MRVMRSMTKQTVGGDGANEVSGASPRGRSADQGANSQEGGKSKVRKNNKGRRGADPC